MFSGEMNTDGGFVFSGEMNTDGGFVFSELTWLIGRVCVKKKMLTYSDICMVVVVRNKTIYFTIDIKIYKNIKLQREFRGCWGENKII